MVLALASVPTVVHAADVTDSPVPAASADAAVPVFANRSRLLYTDGASIYGAICQGCHQADGMGAVGAGSYPSLVKNDVLKTIEYPTYLVLNGHRGMPGFKTMLDDSQVAAVVTYVRTHFGNAYAKPVTPEAVARAR